MNNRKFTEVEKDKIDKLLNKKLAPEYISYRQGFNNLVPYIEGWTAISLANQIFGFDGWSSFIKKMKVDYVDVVDTRYNIGISCIIRVTLKDGTHREDVGFGSSENQRRKGEAFEKAKKEAATDALKRALRQFGNSLGNCCYDKEFIKRIKKFEKKEKDIVSAKDLYRNENNKYLLSETKADSVDLDYFSSDDH